MHSKAKKAVRAAHVHLPARLIPIAAAKTATAKAKSGTSEFTL